VNESVDLQVFVDPDPGVDSTQYRCYYELYCEDAVTEKCPMSEFVCSEFYQIVIFPDLVPLPNIVPPRVGCKYTIRVVFENKVTSMRHYVDYPFEYVEKDIRVIGIGLYTRQDKYTTPVFHQGEEFRLLGFCCANRNPGDEVKLTISSAYPKIETMPAADGVLRMGFKSSKLGRDVIHVELENVTQGRKAVYDLPYLIIENPLYPYNQNKITDELIHATLYPSKQ